MNPLAKMVSEILTMEDTAKSLQQECNAKALALLDAIITNRSAVHKIRGVIGQYIREFIDAVDLYNNIARATEEARERLSESLKEDEK